MEIKELSVSSAEEAGNIIYDDTLVVGKEDGLRLSANIIRKRAAEAFNADNDTLAQYLRKLAKELEQLISDHEKTRKKVGDRWLYSLAFEFLISLDDCQKAGGKANEDS